jgi:hypothetical protein
LENKDNINVEVKEFLKNIYNLNNWFTAHNLSSYAKCDQETKDHIDQLYLEFNKRWKLLIKDFKEKGYL